MPKSLTRSQAHPAPIYDALSKKPINLTSDFNDYQPLKKIDSLKQLGRVQSLLTTIPAMQSGNPLMEGTAKITMGLSLNSDYMANMLGYETLKGTALGALGGAFGAAGISQIATSILPPYASLPLSGIAGYMVGKEALTNVFGMSQGVAGVAGAVIGIGAGIYSIIQQRNAEKQMLVAQAEAIEGQNEQALKQIEIINKTMPLLEDELQAIQKQRDRNLQIIDFNANQAQKTNEITNFEVRRLAKRTLGQFQLQMAYSGIDASSGWFIESDVENQFSRKMQESNNKLMVDLKNLEFQKESMLDKVGASLRDVAYTRMTYETELDYTNRLLKRNLDKLNSNKYAGAERQAKAKAALSFGGATETLMRSHSQNAQKEYYNMSRYYG
jgi:hypothetical protein